VHAGGIVDRESLVALMVEKGEVVDSCRAALSAGATFEVWDDLVSADELLTIYKRRRRHAERSGQSSIGFPEALEALENFKGRKISIGYVDDRPSGGFYFQIFVDLVSSDLVACLGVKPSSTQGDGGRSTFGEELGDPCF
jgi:hypothetical protein